MSEPQLTDATEAPTRDWWHREHPTFTALSGFFTGMLFVTAVPGALVGILRLLLPFDEVDEFLPLVLVLLLVPAAITAYGPTRRFGKYMWVGMVLTFLVVLGVASLVLYAMIKLDR